MRIIVCGGRDYGLNEVERSNMFITLDRLLESWKVDRVTVISGCAPGADTVALDWAKERGHPFLEFPADWAAYPRGAAGPIRNKQMLVEGQPDAIIAFPGGKGTANMCSIAATAGKPVFRFDSASAE